MNTKPPISVSSFIETPPSPPHPMCFPSPKSHKHQRTGLCGCQRAPKSHCISAIGVIILVLAYTAMGSILFVTLEGEEDDNQTVETSVAASKPYPRTDIVNADIRTRTVDRLWSITEDLNILYKENWTRLAAQEVQHFQDTLIRAMRASKTQQTNVQTTIKSNKWTYASAFLYSLTLITTIGYGGIAPKTQWGRIAALLYALFGIPIILLYLSAMGEGLSSGMRCIFRRMRPSSTSTTSSSNSSCNSSNSSSNNKIPPPPPPNVLMEQNEKRPNNFHSSSYCSNGGGNSGNGGGGGGGTNGNGGNTNKFRSSHNHSHNHHHHGHSPTVPISICIMILICYITLGAVLFHKIQPWGVLESLYFCFSSLGTIGFGDLSPKGNLSQYVASGYILIGMAVVAMCFSLIQTELILWLRKFGVQDSVISSSIDDVALVSVTSIQQQQQQKS